MSEADGVRNVAPGNSWPLTILHSQEIQYADKENFRVSWVKLNPPKVMVFLFLTAFQVHLKPNLTPME